MKKLWIVLSFLFVIACAEGEHVESTTSTNDPFVSEKASDILDQKCASCHGASSPGLGDIDYILDTDQLVTFGHVVGGAPESSSVYTEVESDEMPPGNPLSESEKEILFNWITSLGGSVEKVTFQDVYDEIFAPRCIGCHGTEGDINLETYEEAIKTVTTGFPEGSLLYDSVYQGRMPKSPNELLSDEEVEMIYNWIAGGALEE